MLKDLKRIIIISRPIYWFCLMAVYWWGFLLSRGTFNIYVVAGLLFFTIPMGVIVFGTNDIADMASDAINPRKGGVDGAVISKKDIKLIRNTIILGSIFFISLLTYGGRYLAATCLIGIIIFAYTYSVEPIRLKTRPFLDTISNGIWISLVMLSGYFIDHNYLINSRELKIRLSVAFLAGCTFHMLGTVLDYDTDRFIGEKTTGQVIGKRLSLGICEVLLIYCFLITTGDPTQQFFFGTCSLLNLLILANPQTNFIAKMKKVFFYILAFLLPAFYAASYYLTHN